MVGSSSEDVDSESSREVSQVDGDIDRELKSSSVAGLWIPLVKMSIASRPERLPSRCDLDRSMKSWIGSRVEDPLVKSSIASRTARFL